MATASKPSSYLITDALVIPDPLGSQFLDAHAVAIEGDSIAGIGPTAEMKRRYPHAELIDGTGQMLLPGLVDPHTHLYAALTHGMPVKGGTPHNFPETLERVWWQWDKALRDEDNYTSALVGSVCSVRSGITTMVDHHSSPHAIPGSLDRLSEGIDKVGLRACLAYEVSDRDGEECCRQGIEENKRFIEAARQRPDNLQRGLFGLHAVFSLCDETLGRCAAEGAALKTGFHMHMAEHKPELDKFAKTHEERIPEYLARIGILGPQTVLAHTIHVNHADIATMKRSGAINVHNPRSNMGNGNGVAPLIDMFELGQPVGLGSDGYFDLPTEMMLAPLLQTLDRKDPSVFGDSMVLRMVYGHNAAFAERIFGCKLGKVTAGYAADLILVNFEPMTPVTEGSLGGHIVGALAGGARTALVNGRPVLKDGTILGVDVHEMIAKGRDITKGIWARL